MQQQQQKLKRGQEQVINNIQSNIENNPIPNKIKTDKLFFK